MGFASARRGAERPSGELEYSPTISREVDDIMKIRPLGDRVLVKRMESEEKTKGGLYIPETAKEKPIEAKVISVGTGKRDDSGKLIEPSVKAGDRILFGKYSGTEVKLDGEEHLILREEDILGVIEV
jgi:chaperonin GroES